MGQVKTPKVFDVLTFLRLTRRNADKSPSNTTGFYFLLFMTEIANVNNVMLMASIN